MNEIEAYANVFRTCANALEKMAKHKAFDGAAVSLIEAAEHARQAAKALEATDASKIAKH